MEKRCLNAIAAVVEGLTAEDLALTEDYGKDGMVFNTKDGDEYFVEPSERIDQYTDEQKYGMKILGTHDNLTVYVSEN